MSWQPRRSHNAWYRYEIYSVIFSTRFISVVALLQFSYISPVVNLRNLILPSTHRHMYYTYIRRWSISHVFIWPWTPVEILTSAGLPFTHESITGPGKRLQPWNFYITIWLIINLHFVRALACYMMAMADV